MSRVPLFFLKKYNSMSFSAFRVVRSSPHLSVVFTVFHREVKGYCAIFHHFCYPKCVDVSICRCHTCTDAEALHIKKDTNCLCW